MAKDTFNGYRMMKTDEKGIEKQVFPQTTPENIIGLDEHIMSLIKKGSNNG